MLTARSRQIVIACLAVALVAAIGLSVAGSALQPASATTQESVVIGKSAFAYLSGLRTFAAAVLWNRLDPQYHAYYKAGDLKHARFMLPTIRIVQMLDPGFLQAYFVGAWIVAEQGQVDQAVSLARDGLKANPDSGFMRANLIALLQFDADKRKQKDMHLKEQLKLAEEGFSPNASWNNPTDQTESLAIFRDIFRRTGHADLAAQAEAERQRLLPSVPMPESD